MAKKVKEEFDRLQFEEDLAEMEMLLRKLRSEYNQYFAGALKRPPNFTEIAFNKLVHKYVGDQLKKSADRFRYFNVVARYNSMRELWYKKMRQMDNVVMYGRKGGLHAYLKEALKESREAKERVLKAHPEDFKFSVMTKDPHNEQATMKSLHDNYNKASQLVGANKTISQEKLTKILSKRANDIKKKHGADVVEFTVTIKDGKPIITAKGKKK